MNQWTKAVLLFFLLAPLAGKTPAFAAETAPALTHNASDSLVVADFPQTPHDSDASGTVETATFPLSGVSTIRIQITNQTHPHLSYAGRLIGQATGASHPPRFADTYTGFSLFASVAPTVEQSTETYVRIFYQERTGLWELPVGGFTGFYATAEYQGATDTLDAHRVAIRKIN